ncbi:MULTISPECIES: glucosyl-3-phosphoglycerate synthase [unclassified Corynebacterium]|uniref:glucosyl-3-phosphoglycerate synthase n=1 Tax=unclassified Corynebacterium TaxID=2624378 RepID=UPI0008A4E6EA|nr:MULTISPECIES: glucosyl-3-phosphoglycerate synthase [unclassified Corynebacterium]OFN75566.1 glucosyl-3-phosphoglycerate synthase [Corynebacterium sp. HMSC074E01]OFP62858.1 glucosyl-3-phosphoglycerate synthase [Corynebacterium sp. HMSC074C01]OHO62251.1 glucosyl-3-phosphoglycerate synthase [Corynebacterium sp. HMSC036D02]
MSVNVSVVIPALNEERTVAHVVCACLADEPLEVIVIDADSSDGTAARAAAAGARVCNWRDVVEEPPQPGKGESLWRGVAAARGEVVVFIDADLESAAPGMVTALSEPFVDPHVQLVKARYARSLNGQPTGGGRVTELSAKPLLRMFFPELAHIDQPLGGEYAIRRDAALDLPFVAGYGVEAGLLIDVAKRYGPFAIAEVDLGTRTHRNRPLEELAPMADVVSRTILSRAGVAGPVPQRPPLLGKI